ncbi:MAG: alpha/beta fold hydrolase [Methylorubrum extorquens]|jgi:predicted alpha/beta hydrolase|uniref:alpha/beta hydrolase family protein n=1 Tax=Methylorubrum extorquens TaxID=408 RepID=UPI002FEE06A4
MTPVVDAPGEVERVLVEAVAIRCRDDYLLHGHLWRTNPRREPVLGTIIVNPATGVLARYYHAYARFLAEHGFDVLTYDYRGIGASRPGTLRACGIRWRDWGELDFDAAVRWTRGRQGGPLSVVGHSIGGFLPGFAEAANLVDRFLTVGAQFAYWPDYDAGSRLRMVAKWHLAMPAVTALAGYFPGRRLGWLEDLPAGVAYEWSFRRARMELSYPPGQREAILARFAAVGAPILAVGTTDDEFGTLSAIRRGLGYYTSSPRTQVQLTPAALSATTIIGHFSLFHPSRSGTFWTSALDWLRDGRNPWPEAVVHATPPCRCNTEASR